MKCKNLFTLLFFTSLFFTSLHLFAGDTGEVNLSINYDNGNRNIENRRYNCHEDYRGVFEPGYSEKEYLKLRINLNNLDHHGQVSRIKFNIMYTNNGYKNKTLEKNVSFITSNRLFSIPIYQIDDQFPFAVNQVFVTAMVGDQKLSDSFTYRIYRPVSLRKDDDDSHSCYKMYKAQRITGPLSNSSTQPRSLTIEDSAVRSIDHNRSSISGWIVGANYANLINLQGIYTWLRGQGRNFTESFTYSLSTLINPGESMVIAKQMTLVKDPFVISTVNECGDIVKSEKAYLNHWLVTYPVVQADPHNLSKLTNLDVGYNDELDTCNDRLGNYNNPEKIFIPIQSEENISPKLVVNDPTKFNDLGKILTDEDIPVKERKSKFKSWFKRILRKM